MATIKMLHISDTHFGMENYGRVEPKTGLNSRLIDFRNTLNYIIDKAIEKDVDLVLFSGDAYRNRHPNQTHQREFAACLKRIIDKKIPLVMLVGNHDLPSYKGQASSLEIFRVLDLQKVTVIDTPGVFLIQTKRGHVRIAALPYVTKNNLLTKDEYKNLSLDQINDVIVKKCEEIIRSFKEEVDEKIPTVLTVHSSVRNAMTGAEQNIMIGQDLTLPLPVMADPMFDYVALGHIHKFQNLNKGSYPPVIYSGSIERIDFGEENEEKGFVLVELEKGETTYEFIPVPARKFVTIKVDADVNDPTGEIIRMIKNYDVKDAVVRLIYRAAESRLHLVNEKKIADALKDAYYIASINHDPTYNRENRTRESELTEELGPLEALKKYFEVREFKGKRQEKLRELALQLMKEVREEKDIMIPF